MWLTPPTYLVVLDLVLKAVKLIVHINSSTRVWLTPPTRVWLIPPTYLVVLGLVLKAVHRARNANSQLYISKRA